jgi:hypothetical protein
MRQSVAAICFLASIGFAHGQKLSPEVRPFVKVDAPVIALTHVRVIDGTGNVPHENQTVVLSNGMHRCNAAGNQSKRRAGSDHKGYPHSGLVDARPPG